MAGCAVKRQAAEKGRQPPTCSRELQATCFPGRWVTYAASRKPGSASDRCRREAVPSLTAPDGAAPCSGLGIAHAALGLGDAQCWVGSSGPSTLLHVTRAGGSPACWSLALPCISVQTRTLLLSFVLKLNFLIVGDGQRWGGKAVPGSPVLRPGGHFLWCKGLA